MRLERATLLALLLHVLTVVNGQKRGVEILDFGVSHENSVVCKIMDKCLNRGKSYLQSGRYYEADMEFKIALDQNCKVLHLSRIYLLKAIALYMNKDTACFTDFQKAIERDSTEALTFLYRGEADYEFYRYKQALQDFNKAESLDSTILDIYESRAKLFLELDSFDKAKSDIERFLKFKNNCEDKFILAQCFYYIGEVDSSLKYLKQSEKCLPQDYKAESNYLMAWNYFYKNDLNESWKYACKYVDDKPSASLLGSINLLLAYIKIQQGEMEQATSYLVTSINADTTLFSSYYQLADIALSRGDVNKAQDILEKIKLIDSTNDIFNLVKAEIYLVEGKYDLAKEVLFAINAKNIRRYTQMFGAYRLISVLVHYFLHVEYCSEYNEAKNDIAFHPVLQMKYSQNFSEMMARCK